MFQSFFFFFFDIYIYLFIWLLQALVAAHRIFSCGMHVGSSSLTRDQIQAPYIGSMES